MREEIRAERCLSGLPRPTKRFSTRTVAIMRSDYASMQMFYAERGELLLLAYRGFNPTAALSSEWVRSHELKSSSIEASRCVATHAITPKPYKVCFKHIGGRGSGWEP
jgi:hypothetical protein